MDDIWRQEEEEEEFEEIYASARRNRERRGRKRRAAAAMLDDTDESDESNESDDEDEEETDDEEMETEGEDTEGDDKAHDEGRSDIEGDNSCVSDSTISSSGSSTGKSKDQCPVCLMTLKGQKLGKPNNCQHIFCLECIQEWAKNVNTCPVDRKKFNQISVHTSKKGAVISKIKVEDRQMEEEFDEDDPTYCEVCHQCDREDVLLLCDGCDKGYHMDCMTPPLFHVPIEEWFCHQCQQGNERMNEPMGTSSVTRTATSQTRSRGTRGRSRGRQVTRRSTAAGASRDSSSETRARTVASVRSRRTTSRRSRGRGRGRRGRGRTSTSSRTRAGTRKRKRRRKTKAKAGATTSTGKKVIKRRSRKRRKTKAKRRKVELREPRDELEPRQTRLKGTVRERLRDSIQANASSSSQEYGRILGKCAFPSRLEPSQSFSIFGNQMSLETPPELPECELRSTVQQESENVSERPQINNPDVLGSIFEGLQTLHSRNTCITREGNVTRKESGQAISPDESSGKGTQTTGQAGETRQTANESFKTGDVNTDANEEHGYQEDKRFKTEATKEENEKENENKSVLDNKPLPNQNVREKCYTDSIEFRKEPKKHISLSPSTSKIKADPDSSPNFLPTAYRQETQFSISSSSPSTMKSLKCSLVGQTSNCSTETRKQGLAAGASANTHPVTVVTSSLGMKLSSYKIPRKTSSHSHSLKQEAAGTNTNLTTGQHLLEECKGSVSLCGSNAVGYTKTKTHYPSTSTKRNVTFKEQHSVGTSYSRDGMTAAYVDKVFYENGKGTRIREEHCAKQETIQPCVPKISSLKAGNSALSTVQKSTEINKGSIHFGFKTKPSWHIYDEDSHKVNVYGQRNDTDAPETDSRKKQNLDIITMLKHKTLDMRARLLRDMRTGEALGTSSSLSTESKCFVTSVHTTGACADGSVAAGPRPNTGMLAPHMRSSDSLQSMSVTSTSGDMENRKDSRNEEESERRKRRVQGIERLQRKALITQEVKHALKQYFKAEIISKEEYKDILKRAVKKIKESNSSVDRVRVTSLVTKYVKLVKGKVTGEA